MNKGAAPIPEPPSWPIVGHALSLDFDVPLNSLVGFAERYGEIYRLKFPGSDFLVVVSIPPPSS